jgi:hypothetical protein
MGFLTASLVVFCKRFHGSEGIKITALVSLERVTAGIFRKSNFIGASNNFKYIFSTNRQQNFFKRSEQI